MSCLARGAWLFCFACCAILSGSSAGAAPASMDYVYGYIGKLDESDNYLYALLDEALARTKAKWGAYRVHPVPELPRNRLIRELEAGTGSMTMAILDTAHDVGQKLRPVLIPIDKGLVGYRVLLIRADEQAKFAAVRSAEDLKPVNFGLNFIWDDVDILRANGMTVTTGEDFEGLFQMLNRSRFDAFPRSVGEILYEFGEHKAAYPNLRIEKSLLLHYPLPIYFWFSRTPAGEKLAQRLEAGLRTMLADGSFDAIFWKYNRAALADLDIAHRRVLELNNPLLPADTPLGEARLWLTPDEIGVTAPPPR